MNNTLTKRESLAKTMGRCLAFVLVGAMLFGLSACGKPGSGAAGESEPIVMERGAEPPALQTASEASALALRYYIYARLKTEELIAVDVESIASGEMERMADELLSVWETAEELLDGAERISTVAVLLLERATAEPTAAVLVPQTQAVRLAAAGQLTAAGGAVIDRETWAENLTKQFDALRGAQRYQQLAEQLGTDARTACEQMALAQQIIRNAADLEEAQAEVGAYTRSINILETYKTGSKVGLFVGATVATGGGTLASLAGSSMSLGTAGAVLVGGVDCIVEVGKTGSSIILGEDHQVTVDFQKASDVLSPASTAVGFLTLDPTNIPSQIAFVGETIKEWIYPGSITGMVINPIKEGGIKMAVRLVGAPDPQVKGAEEGFKQALEALGLSLPAETDEAVTLEKLIEDYIAEAKAALEKMAELIAEMIALAEEAGEETDTLTGGVDLSGVWGGSAVLVGGDDVEDLEPEESIYFSLSFQEDGGIANVQGFTGGITVSNNGKNISFKVSETVSYWGIVVSSTASFTGTVTEGEDGSASISGSMILTYGGSDGEATYYYDWWAYR